MLTSVTVLGISSGRGSGQRLCLRIIDGDAGPTEGLLLTAAFPLAVSLAAELISVLERTAYTEK